MTISLSDFSEDDLKAELMRRSVIAGRALELELSSRNGSIRSNLNIKLCTATGDIVFASGIEICEIKHGSDNFRMLQEIISEAEAMAL